MIWSGVDIGCMCWHVSLLSQCIQEILTPRNPMIPLKLLRHECYSSTEEPNPLSSADFPRSWYLWWRGKPQRKTSDIQSFVRVESWILHAWKTKILQWLFGVGATACPLLLALLPSPLALPLWGEALPIGTWTNFLISRQQRTGNSSWKTPARFFSWIPTRNLRSLSKKN